MVSLHTLVLLYKAHLRARPLSELLAVLGIAAGVALLFAVQVANKSATRSFEELNEGMVGRASLEVAARGPQGFNQELFRKIKRLPDVEAAAPVVEHRIAVRGPKGRRALTLFGFDERLKQLGGKLVKSVARRRDVSDLGFYLTESTANAIGVSPGGDVTVEVGERTKRLPLAGVASSDDVGSLIGSPVALAHLGLAQEIASMPDSITRILVAPMPGKDGEVKAALNRVSDNKLNVRSSDAESKLLSVAAAQDQQSTALFSMISLVVGILLAYNAMLLTVAERRRVVASLHMLGASNKTIVASLVFDALVMGIVGSVLGVLLGDQLSRHFLQQSPEYLTLGFAIGNQRIIEPQTILLAISAGTLAALAAAARPTINLLRVSSLGAFSEREQSATEIRASTANQRTFWGGAALITLFLVISLLMPGATIVGVVALILGFIMVLPTLVTTLLNMMSRIAHSTNSAALRVSVGELAATPMRATALATVGALAITAIIAITGPASDMRRGIGHVTQSFFVGNADIWVLPRLEENSYITQPFNHEQIASKIERLPAVKSLRIHRGSFFDLDDRRLRIIGESSAARDPIESRQIVRGSHDTAVRRLRQGGWAAVTDIVAKERNLEIGRKFSLPTPSGKQRLRLAATITNYAWPPGALIVNASDYERIWKTKQASALQVDLAEGVVLADGKIAIREALGNKSPLAVKTGYENHAISNAASRQAVARLIQIGDMVLAAAVLAVVAAMLGSVWQRRQRLWGLVSLGMGPGQLSRTIFLETGVILLIGCLIGVGLGFSMQALGGRWLSLTTGTPVAFELAWGLALQTLVLTVILTALVVVLPVRFIFSTKRVTDFTPR